VNELRRLSALAGLALLGCRGPSLTLADEGPTSETDDAGEIGETGADPFACEPWPDPPASRPALPPAEWTPIPRFADATVEFGLTQTAYFPGAWPPTCDPGGEGWVPAPCKMYLQGAGAAVGDFDEDGWPDLYLTRLVGPGLLFRNLGGQSFEELGVALGLVDEVAGNGAAWVDIDGDGDLDLYISSMADPGRFWLYRNRLRELGEASFVEEAEVRGLALADGQPHYGFSIGVGDYDLDGWLDLYTSEWRPGSAPTEDSSHARLLRNLGGEGQPGVFADQTAAAGASMLMKNPAGLYAFAPAFVDLDEDGWPDLTVVSDNGTTRLFWNDGHGGFLDGTPRAGVGFERNGMGSTFGDYDGDGHLDWYVTAIFSPDASLECGNLVCGRGGNRLYRSKGPRCFEELAAAHGVEQGGWGWGAAWFDPDNDGDLDVVATNGFYTPHGPPGTRFAGDPVRLWRNLRAELGVAEFEEVADASGLGQDTGQGRGLIAFDVDRDGDEDLLIVDNGGPSGTGTRLWRNLDGDLYPWLAVELDGRAPNTRGVGARIELRRELDGPVQVRVIGVGTHFLGHGEYRAHFGLGPGSDGGDGEVAQLRVLWPSGAESLVTDLSPRQVVTVVEPE
jgi:enediyne biosynthesis protein E4